MKKKGLSAVITTLIIILLVLVAVGVVWVVIANLVEQSSEKINLGKFTVNMEIKNFQENGDGTINVTVGRNPGKGELEGIKFIVGDGAIEEVFQVSTKMQELGQEIFNLNYNSTVKYISIHPVFKSESGKEIIGDMVDRLNTNFIGLNVLSDYGLFSWWRFQDNNLDYFGKNHGTSYGGVDCNAEGKYGKGCKFDGDDDYIYLDNNSRLSGSQTIAFWYKHATGETTNYTGVLGGSSFDFHIDAGHAIGITRPGGHLGDGEIWSDIYSGDPYGNHRNAIGFPLPLDTNWHFVASSYDTSTNTHKFYLDDEVKNETPNFLTYQIDWGIRNFLVGDSLTYKLFNGTIDELMIFDRALSDEEVMRLKEFNLG